MVEFSAEVAQADPVTRLTVAIQRNNRLEAAIERVVAVADYYERYYGKYMGCSGHSVAERIRDALGREMPNEK